MATQACACLYFDDAVKAIDWFGKVAQFETTFRVDGPEGQVVHSELTLGNVVIMVGGTDKNRGNLSPIAVGGRTGGIYLVMKDDAALTAHYEKAKEQDPGSIDKPPFKTDYGSLDYSLKHQDQILYFGTYSPHPKNEV